MLVSRTGETFRSVVRGAAIPRADFLRAKGCTKSRLGYLASISESVWQRGARRGFAPRPLAATTRARQRGAFASNPSNPCSTNVSIEGNISFSKRKTARLEANYSTEATRSTRERESAASINDRGGKRWSVEPARKWRPNRYGPEFTALHSRGEERSPRHRPQWTGLL